MRQLRARPLRKFLRQLERPPIDMVFVLQDVEDPVNVGSAFRIADACGVSQIVLTGISAHPPHKGIEKTGRGLDRQVRWRYVEQADEAVAELKTQGYMSYALEVTAESVPYDEVIYPNKVCLIVGHEDHGVTKRTLAACDMPIFIPMYGKGVSLNVHVSLAVAAFHVLHAASIKTAR